MDKIKRVLGWVVLNSIFLYGMWLALFQGNKNAENCVIFVVWVMCILSLFLLSDEAIKLLRKNGRPVPKTIDVVLDLLVIWVFVWFGYFVTGVAYMIYFFMHLTAHSRAENV